MDKMNPLMMAVILSNIKLIKLILNEKIDINT